MQLIDIYNPDVAEALYLYVTCDEIYSQYIAIKEHDNISMAEFVKKYKHREFTNWYYTVIEKSTHDSAPQNMARDSEVEFDKCILYIPYQMELKPVLYSFDGVLGVTSNIFDYSQFCYIKKLCQHDVDLWECVHINVQGINLTMLVDESGKLKNLPRSFPASALYGSPFDYISGDVFIVSQLGDELMYLSDFEIQTLGKYFRLNKPYFDVIHI